MAPGWGFITNHALILIYVIRHPESTVRDISAGIGVTERATLAILRELDEEGIVERHRDGRRNTYTVDFPAVASYRRVGTPDRTPRAYVERMVRTLAQISPRPSAPALPSSASEPRRTGSWGFFTNHLVVLLAIAQEGGMTVRDMALRAGMTERAIMALIKQLDDAGIIVKSREGRRNTYAIDFEAFRRFERWSPGAWRLPPELVDAAVDGLRALDRARPEAGRPAPELVAP